MMLLVAVFSYIVFCCAINSGYYASILFKYVFFYPSVSQSQTCSGDIVENPATFGSNVTITCTCAPATGGSGQINLFTGFGPIILLAEISNITSEETLTHVLTNVDASDGGNYRCYFSSVQPGVNALKTITLQIYPYFTAATIAQRVLQMNGSAFNFTCEAEGYPSPSMMALVNITSDPPLTMATTNFRTLNYNFAKFQFGFEGYYQCVTNSSIASTEHNITIICKYIQFYPSLLCLFFFSCIHSISSGHCISYSKLHH